MKIAVDTMGGDYAPHEIVKGSIVGAHENGVDLILVGPEKTLQQELVKYDIQGINIDLVHTDEWLLEGEPPAYTLRRKRNASILLAVKQVKAGKADAIVSAGPTGGVLAAALEVLGTVEGISRPVFGGCFLGLAPQMFAADLGGNVDVRPDQLLDFAVVGTVYVRKTLGIQNPTVALLSNGREDGKGNELTKAAVPLLKQSGLNFIGCVEGHDLVAGTANVIVCDAFVGNIIVKFGEGLGKAIINLIKEELKDKLANDGINSLADKIFSATNIADSLGGGPLLAVNGVVCKGHGRSQAEEFAKVIGQAKFFAENDLPGSFQAELAVAKSKVGITQG
jgi:glycerol-3-phosphate acyltransferase PlsX